MVATCSFSTSRYFSISHEYIPDSLQHGLTVPIPKSSDKDPTNPSNYRGITLLSNVGKLLEKVILQRLHDHSHVDSCLSPLQGGFKPGVCCLHLAMIFQEAFQHIRETGKQAYVALLDVRKAFDTVWHDGLFHKLFQIEIKDHTYLEATEKVVFVVVVLCSMEGHMLQTIPNQPRSQAGGYIISPFI